MSDGARSSAARSGLPRLGMPRPGSLSLICAPYTPSLIPTISGDLDIYRERLKSKAAARNWLSTFVAHTARSIRRALTEHATEIGTSRGYLRWTEYHCELSVFLPGLCRLRPCWSHNSHGTRPPAGQFNMLCTRQPSSAPPTMSFCVFVISLSFL